VIGPFQFTSSLGSAVVGVIRLCVEPLISALTIRMPTTALSASLDLAVGPLCPRELMIND
jgi:hypothetical protein